MNWAGLRLGACFMITAAVIWLIGETLYKSDKKEKIKIKDTAATFCAIGIEMMMFDAVFCLIHYILRG